MQAKLLVFTRSKKVSERINAPSQHFFHPLKDTANLSSGLAVVSHAENK